MLASCPSRELLANPFRTSSGEDAVKTAYVPVIIADPTPPRESAHACGTAKNAASAPSDKPWLTEEVKAAIDKKNELYRVARESNKAEDWTAFKRQRFAVGKLIRANRPARKPRSDFYCDPCECGFADQAEYDDHVAEHVSCDHGGCKFSACPKLVELHVKLQHDTGLVRRLPADGPEDAAEWIRQRKARYPTLHNIAAKKAQEEEMKDRKEVLKTESWKRRGRRPQRRRRRRKGDEGRDVQKEVVQKDKEVKKTEAQEEEEGSGAKFRGTGERDEVQSEEQEEKEDGQITDSDSDRPPVVATVVKKEIEVAGALKSLIACYGSSSEDEEPEEKPSALLPAKMDAAPAEVPAPSRLPQRQPKRKAPLPRKVPHLSKRRLTLLEKLLANEIRHERNVLLQCVHFVVKNKFFDGTQKERGESDGGKTSDVSATPGGIELITEGMDYDVSHQDEERKGVQRVAGAVEDGELSPCENGIGSVGTRT